MEKKKKKSEICFQKMGEFVPNDVIYNYTKFKQVN
jgi:hypothetical protein